MSEIQIRPTIATDLARLMGIDHSVKSESVWQLEVRRETGRAGRAGHPGALRIKAGVEPAPFLDAGDRKAVRQQREGCGN